MAGVAMSEPKQPSWAKPRSSSTTITTFGAPGSGRGSGQNAGSDGAADLPMRARVVMGGDDTRRGGARASAGVLPPRSRADIRPPMHQTAGASTHMSSPDPAAAGFDPARLTRLDEALRDDI